MAGAPLASTSSSRPHRDSATTPVRAIWWVEIVSLGRSARSTTITSCPSARAAARWPNRRPGRPRRRRRSGGGDGTHCPYRTPIATAASMAHRTGSPTTRASHERPLRATAIAAAVTASSGASASVTGTPSTPAPRCWPREPRRPPEPPGPRRLLHRRRQHDVVGDQDHAGAEQIAAQTDGEHDQPGAHAPSRIFDRPRRRPTPTARPATIAAATPRCIGMANAANATTAATPTPLRTAGTPRWGTTSPTR